ncbi:MAG: biopolymer transporter ExbD [Planctomycetota bacterium]
MATNRYWEVRRAGGTKVVKLSERQLAAHVAAGNTSDEHETRPLGSSDWMTIEQAKPFLPEINLVPQEVLSQRHSSEDVASRASESSSTASSNLRATSVAQLPPPIAKRVAQRSRVRSEDESELDMTPMIDMTFLLLIFFMVTSTLSPFSDLELPEAMAGDAEKPEGRAVIVVDYPLEYVTDLNTRLVGSDPLLLSQCRLYFPEDKERLIPPAQLGSKLQQAIQQSETGDVLIQSNRKMPLGVVREIVKIAGESGAGQIMIGVSRPK